MFSVPGGADVMRPERGAVKGCLLAALGAISVQICSSVRRRINRFRLVLAPHSAYLEFMVVGNVGGVIAATLKFLLQCVLSYAGRLGIRQARVSLLQHEGIRLRRRENGRGREKTAAAAQNGGARISRVLRRNKALAHSTTTDLPRQGMDQPGESEQCRDAKGAGDEECGQHDSTLNVTKCIVSLARSCGLGIGVNDNKLLRYRGQLGLQQRATGPQRPFGADGREDGADSIRCSRR